MKSYETEWFMKLSHEYDVELVETKKNILFLKEKLDGLEEKRKSKDNFLKGYGLLWR